jgi:hypothetical protein
VLARGFDDGGHFNCSSGYRCRPMETVSDRPPDQPTTGRGTADRCSVQASAAHIATVPDDDSAADESKWELVVLDEVRGSIATQFEVNVRYTLET